MINSDESYPLSHSMNLRDSVETFLFRRFFQLFQTVQVEDWSWFCILNFSAQPPNASCQFEELQQVQRSAEPCCLPIGKSNLLWACCHIRSSTSTSSNVFKCLQTATGATVEISNTIELAFPASNCDKVFKTGGKRQCNFEIGHWPKPKLQK